MMRYSFPPCPQHQHPPHPCPRSRSGTLLPSDGRTNGGSIVRLRDVLLIRLLFIVLTIGFRADVASAHPLCPTALIPSNSAASLAAHREVWTRAFGREWAWGRQALTLLPVLASGHYEGFTDTGEPFALRCVLAGEVTNVLAAGGAGWPASSRGVHFLGVIAGPAGSIAVGGVQYIDGLAPIGHQSSIGILAVLCEDDPMFQELPPVIPPWVEDGEFGSAERWPVFPPSQETGSQRNCRTIQILNDNSAEEAYQRAINTAKNAFTNAVADAENQRDYDLSRASDSYTDALENITLAAAICSAGAVIAGPGAPAGWALCFAAYDARLVLAITNHNSAVAAINARFASAIAAAKTTYRTAVNTAKAARDAALPLNSTVYECCLIQCSGGECPPAHPTGGGGND